MAEHRLFDEDTVPECATPAWYAVRDRAPHLEQFPHVGRLLKAAAFVLEVIGLGACSVVDLGAGDGGLLSMLGDVPAWGYDLQPSNIEGACERGVDVRIADVLHDPIEWGDCAVATEMLEHLVDPHAFVRTVAEHCQWLVASSPAFETPESHYPHHLWCWDEEGYAALMHQAGLTVDQHVIVDGFQVLLAVR